MNENHPAQANVPLATPPVPPTPIPQPMASPTMQEVPKPKRKFLSILIVLFVLIGLGFLGYWAYQEYFPKPQLTPEITPTPIPTTDQTVVQNSPTDLPEPSNLCTFTDFHFKVDCPLGFSGSVGKIANKQTVQIQYSGKQQTSGQMGFVDGIAVMTTYNSLNNNTLQQIADGILKTWVGGTGTLSPVNVGNTNGYQITRKSEDPNDLSILKTIILANGNNAYNQIDIEIELSDKSVKQNYELLLNQLLNSFQTLP